MLVERFFIYTTMRRQYAIVTCLILLTSCHHAPQPISFNGEAQGSYYSISYYDDAHRDLQHSVDSILDDFDQTASLWVEQSMIRRINSNTDSLINPVFADLLLKSLAINQYSEGAFDCRIGKLVQAWGFSFKQREPLDDHKIDSLLALSRGNIAIDTNENGELYIRKENPQTEIDFNAIAQGYASDIVAAYLESQGISSYLVDIGGEVVAHGTKANGDPWIVGVERPAENKYQSPEIELAIGLQDLSIVTSGNYRKYYEKDGIKYSHTIDPETGRPVEHSLLSVSVIDSSAWRADAMATAFMVMGLEKAKAFIESHPNDMPTQAVLFIYNDTDGYKTYATPQFKKMITE